MTMSDESLPSLEEMWKEAEVRFRRHTGSSLSTKSVTWVQCIDEIKKMQNPDESSEHDSRFEDAKDWGVKMVQCLRLVGGVAAMAGSSVCLVSQNPQALANSD